MAYVVAALAVYRLAHLVAVELGPFDLSHSLRSWAYARWPDREGRESWQFAGMCCVLCVSFWLAWAAAALVPARSIIDYAVNALAISGMVLILHRLFSHGLT